MRFSSHQSSTYRRRTVILLLSGQQLYFMCREKLQKFLLLTTWKWNAGKEKEFQALLSYMCISIKFVNAHFPNSKSQDFKPNFMCLTKIKELEQLCTIILKKTWKRKCCNFFEKKIQNLQCKSPNICLKWWFVPGI